MDARVLWRGSFTNGELNELHAEAFDHVLYPDTWWEQVNRWSLGWVVARDGNGLIGFVNVIWDGRTHAWLQDVMVASRMRRQGVGVAMVRLVTEEARREGCEWLHVDFDDDDAGFYAACGFEPTQAGLIQL